MATTLGALAQLVGGRLAGEASREIRDAAPLADAAADSITFIDHADRLPRLLAGPPAAVVLPEGLAAEGRDAIHVADVHAAFATIVRRFHPARQVTRVGVSPQATVSPTARLAHDVDIHPGAFVGDDVELGPGVTIHSGARVLAGCRLGDQVTVHANAVLYPETLIGARSVIHSGVVLGCHGFGYKLVEGRHQLSAQLGWVEIGQDVEIGANTTIDRGAYGATRIGDGTKIDNQVQIAHNCQIGRHNLICSQVGIAGSTTTGDYVVMAGQVGVRDHVHIGDRAILGAMAGVTNDVPSGVCMIGIPATPEREQKIKQAVLSKLPEMRQQLKQVHHRLAAIEERLGGAPRQEAA